MTEIKFRVLEPVEIREVKFYIGRETTEGAEGYTYIARSLGSNTRQQYKDRLDNQNTGYGGWTQIAFDDSLAGEWYERSSMSDKEEFIKWLRRKDFDQVDSVRDEVSTTEDNTTQDVFEEGAHRDRIANGEFLFSDFDNDSIKNLNDKEPFTAGDPEDQKINEEISLAHELKELEKMSRKHRKVYKEMKTELDHDIHSGRVKQPESILRKLRVKYSDEVTDIIGTTIIAEDREEVNEIAEKLKKKHTVIKDKNYYKNPKQGFYRARHLVIEYGEDEVPAEIQIKTKEQMKLHKKAHKRYKQGNEPTQEMKRKAKELAER